MEVWHEGAGYAGDLTATRREQTCWWAYARFVVGVGHMRWHWKHEDELRARLRGGGTVARTGLRG